MDALRQACVDVFGCAPKRSTSLHGGDLSDVARITLDDGRIVVAKTGPMVACEGRMLAALAPHAPCPHVLGQTGDVLFLEHLEESRPTPHSWAQFGADLTALHATIGPRYGWAEDYAFGPVALPNATTETWPEFWAERRLLPHIPYLPVALARRVDTLAKHLSEFLPAAPPPALLHGDLWLGNLLTGPGGRIYLIDPASYYGDGEVDLAMLNLFGSPGPGFTEAYGPLAPGWQTRRAIYSLFPALVHVQLFGSGYHGMVERFLTAAGV